MKLKMFLILLTAICLIKPSFAQETNKKALPDNQFTIENCINKLQIDRVTQTSVGYQYWFIPQN